MRISFCILCLLALFDSFCQSKGEWQEMIIEDYMSQNPDVMYDIQEIENRLSELIDQPVVLDDQNLNEIDRLFFLNPILIANMKNHLNNYGNLISIYELQSIKGIDADLARNLSHLIVLKSEWKSLKKSKFKFSLKSGVNQLLVLPNGFSSNKYVGSAHRYFLRSKFDIGKHIQFGFSFDKDVGENYWNKNYPVKLAHGSGFINFKGKKCIKNIILGDYKLMIGQGLLIYQGYGFGKTIHLPGNIKTEARIAPNTSLSENFFLRGLAGDFKLGKFRMIPFFSFKSLAATIHSDSTMYFKSIDLSGSLKTEAEIERNGKLKEWVAGISTVLQMHKLQISFNYMASVYNYPYYNAKEVYQVFNQSSNHFQNISLDYKIHFNNGFLYGESAFNLTSKAFSTINGIIYAIGQKTSLLASVRYYSPKYFSFYASGLSENSTTTNEFGIMMNLEHKFNRNFTFSSYFDYFYFPWLKFNVDRPSNGFEVNTRFHYKWNRKMYVYGTFRFKQKEENWENHSFTNSLIHVSKYQTRIHFYKKLNNELSFSSRLEYNLMKRLEWSHGFLFYLNLQFQPNSKLMVVYRFNLFATESFDNSIYALERSVGTVNRYSVYSGEGIGSNLFVRIKAFRKFSIQLRLSWTHYFNQTSIGTGNNMIQGNNKGEIGLELNFKN